MPRSSRYLFLLALLAFRSTAFSDELEGKLVSEIRIEGLRYTKEYIVLRELASRVGEPYSAQKIQKDRERLDRLRIFRSIDLRVEPDGEAVRITVVVAEILP